MNHVLIKKKSPIIYLFYKCKISCVGFTFNEIHQNFRNIVSGVFILKGPLSAQHVIVHRK